MRDPLILGYRGAELAFRESLSFRMASGDPTKPCGCQAEKQKTQAVPGFSGGSGGGI